MKGSFRNESDGKVRSIKTSLSGSKSGFAQQSLMEDKYIYIYIDSLLPQTGEWLMVGKPVGLPTGIDSP